MTPLITFCQNRSSGKSFSISLILAFLTYSVMIFYTIPNVMSYSTNSALLDMSPMGYSYTYVVDLFKALGADGRAKYLYLQLPVDFLYPALFGVSCSLLLAKLFLRHFSKDSKIFYLCFAPVVAALFDYVENICIIYMLTSFPNVSEVSAQLSSIATIFKSGFTTIFFFCLIGMTLCEIKKVLR